MGSSKYDMYQVWLRLDEKCAKRTKKMDLRNNSKWRKYFLGANGCGIYQSTWYHPRNKPCRNCLDRPHGS